MIIYIDMDDVMCQFSASYTKAISADPDEKYPQSVAGFFLDLEPMPNAIRVIEGFRKDFDVHILTAPSTRNPLCYTEKRLWVERHFDYEFTQKLIISPNKGLLRGDFLIDDHIEGRGQENFEGQLIQFGSTEFPDWESVDQFFRKTVDFRN
ncbi:UNVERIFIED_CONTAM: hypothetical protein GTU68_012730 [Idotea baltica]|nr:hypothetical protein [Idotea baltica]